jgi:hypothetical protein
MELAIRDAERRLSRTKTRLTADEILASRDEARNGA